MAMDNAEPLPLTSPSDNAPYSFFTVKNYKSADLGSALNHLDDMVGWDEIKDMAHAIARREDDIRLLSKTCGHEICIDSEEAGFSSMLIDSPVGGGKTTAARTLAQIMAASGQMPTGRVVCCTASGLLDVPERKVMHLFQQGSGAVIIVDQIGTLCGEKASKAAKRVLNALNAQMEESYEDRKGTIVIATCKDDERDVLLEENPAFTVRFQHRYSITAYTNHELREIYEREVKKRGLVSEEGITRCALDELKAARNHLGPQFGNAATVKLLVNDIAELHRQNAAAQVKEGKATGKVLMGEDLSLGMINLKDVPFYSYNSKSFKPYPDPKAPEQETKLPSSAYTPLPGYA